MRMNSKSRFSNRVDYYVKYRPSYPEETMDYLYRQIGLSSSSTIAEIGSGTGIFTRLLLARGSKVFAIEPNSEMREVATRDLHHDPNFVSVEGSAEETTLPDHSVDFIVCAQSFHWFDREQTKVEFSRIMKEGGKVILVWNQRLDKRDEFSGEYEALLVKYAKDYQKINHRNIGEKELLPFFKDGIYETVAFPNQQRFNLEEMMGRHLSSSYSPMPGDDYYEAATNELKILFAKYENEGKITFDYRCELFCGQV